MKRRFSALLALILIISILPEQPLTVLAEAVDETIADESFEEEIASEAVEAEVEDAEALFIGDAGMEDDDEALPLPETDEGGEPAAEPAPIEAVYGRVAVESAAVKNEAGATFARIRANSMVLVTEASDAWTHIAFNTESGIVTGRTDAGNIRIMTAEETDEIFNAIAATDTLVSYDGSLERLLVTIECRFVDPAEAEEDAEPDAEGGDPEAVEDPEGTENDGDAPDAGNAPGENGESIPDLAGAATHFDIVSDREIELFVGATHAIEAVDGNGAPIDDGELVFFSSDEAVASVDESGVITANEPGTADISVGYQGELLKSSVTVPKEPTAISIVAPKATIGVSEKYPYVEAVLQPADSKATVTWRSGNKKYVKINAATGEITGVKKGSAYIYATVVTSKGKLEVKRKITVKSKPSKITLPKTLSVGLTQPVSSNTISYKLPSGSASAQLRWESSNPKVLVVNEKTGELRRVTAGDATITAWTYNDKKGTCKVTVCPDPTGIVMPATATLHVGGTATLKPYMIPTTALPQNNYVSSDPTVVTVNASGKITAKAPGTAIISATDYKGHGSVNSCKVTVYKKPTSVALNRTSTVTLGAGGMTYQFTATVKPVGEGVNQGNPNVTWSSSNKKVATVDQNGLVTTTGKTGTAKITVKTSNGKKKTCKIKVKPAPKSVKMSVPSLRMMEGGTHMALTASVKSPSDAKARFTFSSSDEDIARYENGMIVTGNTTGTVTITATAQNGVSADCVVTVLATPTRASFAASSVKLDNFVSVPLDVNVYGVNNAEAYDGEMTFKSSNTKCVSVSAKGVMTAKANGSATITATTVNGVSAEMNVNVDLKFAATAVQYALAQIGRKYKAGGGYNDKSAKAFDCSGLTAWCYFMATGKKNVLKNCVKGGQASQGDSKDWIYSRDDLEPGDVLVFWNDGKTKLTHVGLYIGGKNMEFVHASASAGVVKKSNFTDKAHGNYWRTHLHHAYRPYP